MTRKPRKPPVRVRVYRSGRYRTTIGPQESCQTCESRSTSDRTTTETTERDERLKAEFIAATTTQEPAEHAPHTERRHHY